MDSFDNQGDFLGVAGFGYRFSEMLKHAPPPDELTKRLDRAFGDFATYGNSVSTGPNRSESRRMAGLSKRSFEDAMPEDDDSRKTQRRAMSDVFERDSCCRCDSRNCTIKKHATECLQTDPIELIRMGLSKDYDHSNTSLPSLLEKENFVAMMKTIEHMTDAQMSEFWDALVPVVHRDPNAPLSVIVSVTRYLPAMAQHIAQHGMPAIVHSKTEMTRSTLELYALAAVMPCDVFTSTFGIKQWMQSLVQISKGHALSQRYQAACAVASAWKWSVQRPGCPMAMNSLPTIDVAYDNLARTFAFLQSPSQTCYPQLITHLERMLHAQHADEGERVMVASPEVVTVLTRENQLSTRHDVSGERGPNMLIEEDLTIRTLYGQKTYVVPVFRLPPNRLVHPFHHYEEIGEFVTMFDDTPRNGTYVSATRDRMVYTDKGWDVLRFAEAIERLPFWNDDGTVKQLNFSPGLEHTFPYPTFTAVANNAHFWAHTRPMTLGSMGEFIDKVDSDLSVFALAVRDIEAASKALQVPREGHIVPTFDWFTAQMATLTPTEEFVHGALEADLHTNLDEAQLRAIADETRIKLGTFRGRLAAKCTALGVDPTTAEYYASVGFTKQALIKLHSLGIRIPLNIIVARPHKRYITSDVALMVRGKVAVRLDRPGLAAIVTNQDRTHSIITEKYMGTALVAPKNIVFARNAVVIARLGGEGLEPIDPSPTKYDPMNYSFSDGSAIYIPVPLWWRGSIVPTNLNLFGDVSLLHNYFASVGNDNRKNGYPSSDVISEIFGLVRRAHSGERVLDGVSGVEGVPCPPNAVCRMEPFYKCDEHGVGVHFVAGDGFWKPEATYDDAFRVRTGGVFNPPQKKETSVTSGR